LSSVITQIRHNFRGDSAAASLKLHHVAVQHQDQIDFRGDSAAASLKQCPQALQGAFMAYFRGDSAAASLKPVLPSRHRVNYAGFPRRFRRGLIEAACRHPAHTTLADFRGDSAAASLKHLETEFCDIHCLHFRGDSAAASLKHRAQHSAITCGRISAAIPPRPH